MKITAAVVESSDAPFQLEEVEFDQINAAAQDAADGRTIKPVMILPA